MTTEKVFTVDGYWDGPIAGCANYKGIPHYFDVLEENSETDADSLMFTLILLDEEIFKLILENWEILLRWDTAFEKGETTLDTHPVLPDDKSRYISNKKIIDSFLFKHQNNAIVKEGIFKCILESESMNKNIFEVLWS